MKIGFIGAGKVGTAFGRYLKNHGFLLAGYYSKRSASAKKATTITGSKCHQSLASLSDTSDILFITTPDNVIGEICTVLQHEKLIQKGQVIGHMSGSFSSEILDNIKTAGAFVFSLHPMLSFADVENAVLELEHAVFSIEGDRPALLKIEKIIKKIGNPLIKLKPDQKAIYHASACIISNYLTTLINEGLSLLEKIGINKQDGIITISPLIQSTIKNIQKLGTAEALTGPIARGDDMTIKKHLDALNTTLYEEHLDFYTYMGKKTLDLAIERALTDKKKIDSIKKLFENDQ